MRTPSLRRRSQRARLAAGVVALAVLLAPLIARPAEPDSPREARRVDRVIDLLAHLGRARRSPGAPDTRHAGAAVDPEDPRDRLAYVRVPAGEWIEWRGLRAGADATLVFGCGAAWCRDGLPGAPVTFHAEAWPEGAPRSEAVHAELRLGPDELAPPRRVNQARLALGVAPATWTVRFEVDAGGAAAAWPGIFEPRIESAGRVAEPADDALRIQDLDLDLLAALDGAEVLQEDAALPLARAPLDTGQVELDGRRTCLRAAAPSRVRYRVTPAPGARLAFALGMDRSAAAAGSDGMRFAVEVNGRRLFERTLRPATEAADRSWSASDVDLGPYAGEPLAIDLVTEPLDSAAHDVGGWASPRLVRLHERPRLAAEEAPTVIVLLADTMRADRLGAGREGSLTPRLDAEAAHGVRFRQARSVTSWTWPTIASLFTGLYPQEHGVDGDDDCFLAGALDTLAERFQRSGYTTGAFVANPLIGGAAGFDQGFETYVHMPSARGRALNDRVLAWCDATEGLARVAYVHYFDIHQPYLPPAEFAPGPVPGPSEEVLVSRIAASLRQRDLDDASVDRLMARQRLQYDAEVRYLDTAVGELLDALERRGVLDDALIVFASDHGEEFREHGLTGHGWQLYDETVRIPLFIEGHGTCALAPAVVDRAVEIRDVLPTLVDALGLPRDGRERLGGSLLDRLAPAAVFSQTGHGVEHGIPGLTIKCAVVRDGWKLIRTPANGREELYDLRADPGERDDRARREPARATELAAALDAWQARGARPAVTARVATDEEARRDLQALGYLGR
ncbi:MAG TPA: sulfatase-like hydrolase/transferase [Planctomycetota bacterium]|nr:sulfatase-like hydrolase/transferase [Planctomycetota bacterium]